MFLTAPNPAADKAAVNIIQSRRPNTAQLVRAFFAAGNCRTVLGKKNRQIAAFFNINGFLTIPVQIHLLGIRTHKNPPAKLSLGYSPKSTLRK